MRGPDAGRFVTTPATVREPWAAASLVEQHACHPRAVAPPRPDGTARTTSCGRRCLFRSTAEARHTAGCPRVEELASEVGSQPWPSGPAPQIDGLGTSFVLVIPSNLGAVTAVSSMARCRRAVWAREPRGSLDPPWCACVRARARACVYVCVCGSRGVTFAFPLVGCCHHRPRDATAIDWNPAHKTARVGSVSTDGRHITHGGGGCARRNTQLPGTSLM